VRVRVGVRMGVGILTHYTTGTLTYPLPTAGDTKRDIVKNFSVER
jgi:hypothetical protein